MSEAHRERRLKRWKHTSLIGHCAMGQSQMRDIQRGELTTDAAKSLAASIAAQLAQLALLLKERTDG